MSVEGEAREQEKEINPYKGLLSSWTVSTFHTNKINEKLQKLIADEIQKDVLGEIAKKLAETPNEPGLCSSK